MSPETEEIQLEECPRCEGIGWVHNEDRNDTCPKCKGTGEMAA